MASSSSSVSSSPSAVVAAVTLLLLLTGSEAREFLVGGSAAAWGDPASSGSLNRWAEAKRFQIGDVLVWSLQGKNEPVLQVSREDYLLCNGSSPVARGDGATGRVAVELDRSGPYYFISGEKGACEKGAKVIVVVMSKRRVFVGAPAPSPAELEAPAAEPIAGGAAGLAAGLLGGVVVALGLLI